MNQARRPRITITATLECTSVDSESYAESDSRALARHAVGYPRTPTLGAPCGVDSPRKQGLLQIVDSPHPSALDALARAPPSALVARVLALRGSCCSVSALPSLLCHDCGLVEEESKVSGGGFERSQHVDCSVVWYSMVVCWGERILPRKQSFLLQSACWLTGSFNAKFLFRCRR